MWEHIISNMKEAVQIASAPQKSLIQFFIVIFRLVKHSCDIDGRQDHCAPTRLCSDTTDNASYIRKQDSESVILPRLPKSSFRGKSASDFNSHLIRSSIKIIFIGIIHPTPKIQLHSIFTNLRMGLGKIVSHFSIFKFTKLKSRIAVKLSIN